MSDAPETDGYCFGCDRAILHCLCYLAGLGEDDEPRADLPLTIDQLLAAPRVKALVEAADRSLTDAEPLWVPAMQVALAQLKDPKP